MISQKQSQAVSADALVMPEYGRNVQRMVEYALTIENKEERTRCVNAIMHTMENLFPYLKNEESRHKMYDHLALMSGFRLDIDSPYDYPSPEELRYSPDHLPYNTTRPLRFRHYGRILESMIAEAIAEQNVERKKIQTLRIAARMRQNFLVWNKDNIDENRLKEDIAVLSKGQLDCNFPEFARLLQQKPILIIGQPNQKKKHKKRK